MAEEDLPDVDPDPGPDPDPEPVHTSDALNPTIRSFTVRVAGGAASQDLNIPRPQQVIFEWDVPTAGCSFTIDQFGPVSGKSHTHTISTNDNTRYVLIARPQGGQRSA